MPLCGCVSRRQIYPGEYGKFSSLTLKGRVVYQTYRSRHSKAVTEGRQIAPSSDMALRRVSGMIDTENKWEIQRPNHILAGWINPSEIELYGVQIYSSYTRKNGILGSFCIQY